MDNALHAFSVRLNHLLLCRPPTVFVQPKLLAALAAEPEQLARRLVELKTLLPQADVASIVAQACCWGYWKVLAAGRSHVAGLRLGCLAQAGTPSNNVLGPAEKLTLSLPLLAPYSLRPAPPLPQRPSLLLDGEWEQVPGGVAALAARYNEDQVARLATAEPLLLVEELEHVLQELGRWGLFVQSGLCGQRGVVWAGWCCGQGGVVGRVVLWSGAGAGVLTQAACQSGGFGSASNAPVLCSSPAQRRSLLASPTATPQAYAGPAAVATSSIPAIAGQQRVPPAAPQPVVASVTPAGSAAGLPAGLWARGATLRPCCCAIRRWCTACSGAAAPWAPAPSSDQSM